jgi:uncharacterized membrane protein YgdD (TMEM256/DUF423 family)
MNSKTAAFASFSLAISVILGAWNAHGMEALVQNGSIDLKYLKTFHTGVEYQFLSSLGLLAISMLPKIKQKLFTAGIWLIIIGMILFCLSLYLLSFHQILGAGWKILGAIAPIGGTSLAAGWVFIGISFLKFKP